MGGVGRGLLMVMVVLSFGDVLRDRCLLRMVSAQQRDCYIHLMPEVNLKMLVMVTRLITYTYDASTLCKC